MDFAEIARLIIIGIIGSIAAWVGLRSEAKQ